MSLSAKYQAFLAAPSSGALVENASLHYITTLTSINSATSIIKHYAAQSKVVKKKSEKVLNVVEGSNSLALDVEVNLEFVAGGGAYLLNVDQEFVSDRLATFPMVHMVHFDGNQQITQIRLFWDQAQLLKQIELIGARAKNWPIRDGKDQARLIASSAKATASDEPAPTSRRSTNSRGAEDVTISERPTTASSSRSSRSSTLNAMNDPHASLSLFENRDVNQETPRASYPAQPRTQSAKPPPRDLSELFVGEDAGTPSKQRIPNKSGGGKNFRANRLFEDDEEPVPTPMRENGVKTNAKKYNHFEFGDGEDTPKIRESRPSTKSKHQSNWDFEDFVTPEKHKEKIGAQQVRHFGWSDNEDEGSPVRRPIVHKARPDADAHFAFQDDNTPEAQRQRAPSKGQGGNKGMGLYRDHVTHSTSDDEGENAHPGDVKRPLGDVTTVVHNENRSKDFGSHWDMEDESPAAQKNGTRHITANQKKVLNTLDSHWAFSESPEASRKENRGIKTAGNGMGARKGTGASWSLGDVDEDEPIHKTKAHRQTESKGLWDF